MYSLKRAFLHGLLFAVFAITPFAIGQASADIQGSNVQVETAGWGHGGHGWGGYGGWGHSGWGWGGGYGYYRPYSYNYYPYSYNYGYPYYYNYSPYNYYNY